MPRPPLAQRGSATPHAWVETGQALQRVLVGSWQGFPRAWVGNGAALPLGLVGKSRHCRAGWSEKVGIAALVANAQPWLNFLGNVQQWHTFSRQWAAMAHCRACWSEIGGRLPSRHGYRAGW